ncbi:sodium/substrate symporter small subunit [Halorubrum ejinorense]|uniref:Sodium/substrate symporter small subunit n=1 Tax=Halorubrum ejinorense TaxID=425309 RepID=A0AAV3SPE7_9EURY
MSHDNSRSSDDVATDGGRTADDAATDGGRTADDAATDGGRTADDAATDGGVATGAAQTHNDTDYLGAEVNILNPSTPYMRDHLRIVWTGFAIWVLAVWGPVTLTRLAPGPMTSQMPILGFPLHYFLVAFGAPTSALILAFWYSRKRDALDEKYGIDHASVVESSSGAAAAAADGGTEE